MSESAAPALAANVVADVIDNGQVSRQQILVVGLCMFFNMQMIFLMELKHYL